jgi:hypothetical protein
VTGNTRSCGCLHRDRVITHGLSKCPEYTIWIGMRRRCEDPDDKGFKNYGGRGITVCPDWRDFARFLADVGPRPSTKHSLERRDNAAGYAAENVVWATDAEQNRNMRPNVVVTYAGRTMILTDWALRIGLSRITLGKRLRAGWSPERAMTTPSRKNHQPLLTVR